MATVVAPAAFVGVVVALDHVVHDVVRAQRPDIGHTAHIPARCMDD